MMPHDWTRSLLSAIARCPHDRCGASATMVAITLPVLIGFAALGVETGLWYTIKQQNQSAADAAVISAAYEVIAEKTNLTGDLIPAASEAAAQNGYLGSTPEVIYPYSDSTVSTGVAVTLYQTQGALLASLFLPSVTIATKAVAVTKVFDNPCILALATTGIDIAVGASSSLDMPTCSVAANSTSRSSIDIQSSTGSITAATLVTPGEVSLNGSPINPAAPPSEFTLTSQPMIGAPTITDPYAGTLTHIFDTTGIPTTPKCTGTYNNATNVTTYTPKGCVIGGTSLASAQGKVILPGNTRITAGWDIKNKTVDLLPGTYWITNGNLTLGAGAAVTCSTCSGANGVTIILTTRRAIGGTVGNVRISAAATVTLQSPNSGTFSGLLLIQDSTSAIGAGVTYTSGGSSFDAGSGMHLTGLLYFPNTAVNFLGSPGTTCSVLIADVVTIGPGNSNFTTSGCASAGLTILPVVNTVVLAE
jgi:Flp pilus assembly protein TadG